MQYEESQSWGDLIVVNHHVHVQSSNSFVSMFKKRKIYPTEERHHRRERSTLYANNRERIRGE